MQSDSLPSGRHSAPHMSHSSSSPFTGDVLLRVLATEDPDKVRIHHLRRGQEPRCVSTEQLDTVRIDQAETGNMCAAEKMHNEEKLLRCCVARNSVTAACRHVAMCHETQQLQLPQHNRH